MVFGDVELVEPTERGVRNDASKILHSAISPLKASVSRRFGAKMMETLGRHLIGEFYGCDRDLLDDLAGIRDVLLRTAAEIGATVVDDAFHRFAPQGVSGAVVIAESHLSVHTWPESAYASIDIYTCGGLDPRPGFRFLARALRAAGGRVQEIVRGLPAEVQAGETLLPGDVQILSRTVSLEEFDTAA